MPEWLYPGVFLQEVPTGIHAIPGVNTSTTPAGISHKAIVVRYGAMPALGYLRWLAQRAQSATGYATKKPNAPGLWANVTLTLQQLLSVEWRLGQLKGQRQSEAYYVRCDRTTMTQAEIASGKLVALVGVALVKPTEFTVLRIEQSTANSRA
jgi:phage tail sheath protein FI